MSTRSAVPVSWQVPQLFRQRIGERSGRQRAMFSDGHLLLVLHAAPRPDDAQRVGRLFWRQPDGTWTSDKLGPGLRALEQHLAEYDERLETLDDDVDQAASAAEYFEIIRTVAPLHRAAHNQQAALQQARQLDAADRNLINLRDRAEEIELAAELVYSEARCGLDYSIAREVEQQSRSSYQMTVLSHRLNVLAAFFFPLATLSAIFGMNLYHGLDDAYAPLPFVGIVAAGLVLGFWLRATTTRGLGRPVDPAARGPRPNGRLERGAASRGHGPPPPPRDVTTAGR